MSRARILYADSERSADLFYAVGMFVPDPFLFVQQADGKTHMVISALEIDRARRCARVDQLHDLEAVRNQVKADHPDWSLNAGSIAAGFVLSLGITELEAPFDFPLGVAEALRMAGVTVVVVEGAFWPQRAIKRDDEVAAIAEALQITEQGMRAGIELIRSSRIGDDGWLYIDNQQLTSEMVRAEINATLTRLGASPHHTIVAGGAQAADPHEEGSGPLAAHRAIIMDVFPRVEKSGYWGDMTRTVCRGEPSEQLQRAWDAVLAGQEKAFELLGAGVSGKAVHDAVTQVLTDAGFPTGPTADGRQGGFFHGTGHGLGVEIHEPPRVSSRDSRMETGHVVTVEPGLYYPDMGGVRLEDVVVIEPDGCRNLTAMPKFFQV
ncbi:M24 family metallopeptidase [Magnetofaba australis]|uniref:Putative peptidase M24 n=1 Tax=Magnetofaba australis IT-1 TaxID=1434232 RepID=A0A1Y2K175_9PROT|nr:Xaa-Pro peptidase family protein [Magnetofaba australis]OSM00051.1 putative peptidase M24 [Magnetofaba australis IT-1]